MLMCHLTLRRNETCHVLEPAQQPLRRVVALPIGIVLNSRYRSRPGHRCSTLLSDILHDTMVKVVEWLELGVLVPEDVALDEPRQPGASLV